jgi:hypothetical protein
MFQNNGSGWEDTLTILETGSKKREMAGKKYIEMAES